MIITQRVLRVGGLAYLADIIGWSDEQLPDRDWGDWHSTRLWVEEVHGRLSLESCIRLFQMLYVEEAA